MFIWDTSIAGSDLTHCIPVPGPHSFLQESKDLFVLGDLEQLQGSDLYGAKPPDQVLQDLDVHGGAPATVAVRGSLSHLVRPTAMQ